MAVQFNSTAKEVISLVRKRKSKGRMFSDDHLRPGPGIAKVVQVIQNIV